MNKNSDAKVIVGLSGGVDSSVAALLLQQQGYDVSAVFMQNWDDDDEQCTTRQDYRDASAVCAKLDIELSTVNFEKEYWDRVFAHFLDEYSAGRTPNPDILCNKEIKFKAFLNHAQSLGCDYIATGHYAQRRVPTRDAMNDRSTDGIQMLRGVDNNKDQTYFLYTLGQKELANTLFPVGDRPKNQVRELAKNAGFHLFSKKDSTGICFIGERKFSSFLSEYLPARPGRMLTTDGREIGTHNGLMYYTIGQRQGLGIGGRSSSSDEPWYVLEKNVSDNELIVGQGHDHPLLYKSGLYCHDLHWCAGAPPSAEFSCSAKTRYRQQDQPARVEVPEQQSQTSSARVTFAEPVRALTPGQSIVFYDHEVCVGGAVISEAF